MSERIPRPKRLGSLKAWAIVHDRTGTIAMHGHQVVPLLVYATRSAAREALGHLRQSGYREQTVVPVRIASLQHKRR